MSRPAYPPTPAQPIEETIHGQKVRDPYRWLENADAPEVKQWMTAEDALARTWLHRLPGRDAFARRYGELEHVDQINVPQVAGGRLFYERRKDTDDKSVLCFRPLAGGSETVLINPNLGKDALGVWVPSWDGRRVAYAMHPNAADEAVLHVIGVDSGQVSAVDVIPGGKYASPSWTPDSEAFYYVNLPTDPSIPVADRPGYAEVRLHRLGRPPSTDPLIYPRTKDAETFLGASLSRDGTLLFVGVERGWVENTLYVKRLGVDHDFKLMVKGRDTLYRAVSWKGFIYIWTDEGAPNGRVFRTSAEHPERAAWEELIPEEQDASLRSIDVVGGTLALEYLRSAVSELKLAKLTGTPLRTIALPGLGTATNLSGAPDEDAAFYQFSSFSQPPTVFQTSVRSGDTQVWAKTEVPVDSGRYEVEQVWYPSKDGTRVSMFLVHRKGFAKTGDTPTLMYGYGGFDIAVGSVFTSFLYPWLEAGGLYALPNLRGGGEYGKAWHEAGKLHRKQNVFDDFIAAAQWLQQQGYTRPDRLAIKGGSNGGLLTGTVMTQRPELFGAVICAVPLLDMVRFDRFGSGKTWVPEYGDPADPDDFAALYAYSPYHHVRSDAQYPPLLMLSADHDDRVDPMHARKLIAEMQATSSEAPAFLRIERASGHRGADLVKQNIEMWSDQMAFLFHALQVKTP